MRRLYRDVLILIALVLAMRLPFLNQAIGGDEPYYLAAAEHAQIDPLHPNHTWFVFQGKDVTFRGYPHPPGNAWLLAALLAWTGDIYEIPFHLAYIVFSLAAVLATYSIARRFSSRPLLASIIFAAVPVFVINGNTLESDLPFLAFWTTGFAFFVWDRRLLATVPLCASALVSYQSALALPILLLYDRKGWRSWIPAATPLLTLIAWQCFEKISSGQFPAEVTAGYLSSYGYQRWTLKLRNAVALLIHSWFLIFPLLVPFAIASGIRRRQGFLLGWIVCFLGAAMVLFYAGAARYILPIAPPFAILASELRPRFVLAATAAQFALSVALATVNYQHWNAYREFARNSPTAGHRVWANAEWGLRFYLEAQGSLPVHEHQWIPTGDIVFTSDLGYPVEVNHGGRRLVPIAQRAVDSAVPLRLFGLDSPAAYATNAQGFLPFAVASGPIDCLHAELLVSKPPESLWLNANAPDFEDQAIAGVFRLEEGRYRWTGGRAVFVFPVPRDAARLTAEIYVPETAKARHIQLRIDGRTVATRDISSSGKFVLESPLRPVESSGTSVTVSLETDQTFLSPGDDRKLGVILTGIGFR